MARRHRLWVWTTVGLLLLAGLAGLWYYVQRQHQVLDQMSFSSELLSFTLTYHTFAERQGFTPREFADIEEECSSFPKVCQMIRETEFVIRWNALLNSDGSENDKFVLGYESNVPSEGGWVLLGGGTRMRMSAEEFRAWPLIATKK